MAAGPTHLKAAGDRTVEASHSFGNYRLAAWLEIYVCPVESPVTVKVVDNAEVLSKTDKLLAAITLLVSDAFGKDEWMMAG